VTDVLLGEEPEAWLDGRWLCRYQPLTGAFVAPVLPMPSTIFTGDTPESRTQRILQRTRSCANPARIPYNQREAAKSRFEEQIQAGKAGAIALI
jgi:hypothetical protein